MFQEPLASKSPGINKLAISPVHGLIGAAGEEGLLECFDMRQEQCAGRFDASQAMGCVSIFNSQLVTNLFPQFRYIFALKGEAFQNF